ncbi:hypothetical protein BH23BAC4_BH23BAC4_06030 [soil metagenome]
MEIDLSLVIGITGIVLAIFFYISSRRNKLLAYSVKSIPIIYKMYSTIPGLTIYHKDQKIEQLVSTEVVIWNKGSDIIDRDDVAQSQPVTLSITKDFKVLDISISRVSSSANNFNLVPINNDSWRVEFEYFGANEGLSVQILHDYETSFYRAETEAFEVIGTIKGSPPIIRVRQNSATARAERVLDRSVGPLYNWVDGINNRVMKMVLWPIMMSIYTVPLFMLLIPALLLDALRNRGASPPKLRAISKSS